MIPKKVCYVPGLISLIGLPILLLLFGPEDEVQQHALKFNLPQDKMEVNDSEFTKGLVLKSIENCKVIDITLWDKSYYSDHWGTYISNKKLSLVQREMERLQFTHDTSTILKVELSENNTYGEFVWLVNQTVVYGIKRFAFFDDAFYFYSNEPPIDNSKFPVEPLYIGQSVLPMPGYTPPTEWNIFKRHLQYEVEEIIYMLKRNWLLSIGFLLLIIIPSFYYLFKKKNIIVPVKQLVMK